MSHAAQCHIIMGKSHIAPHSKNRPHNLLKLMPDQVGKPTTMSTITVPETYKKTFQYRLKPTPEQLVALEKAAGAVRFVYNWGTDLVRKASQKRDPIPNYYVLAKNLTHLKREPDREWLKESYNASLQNGLKDLDLSVKAFFREIKKKNRAGLPSFRKKGVNESIRFSSGIKHVKGKFYVPKIGFLKYFNSRPLQGTIKQATLCKIIDKWFINVVCDVQNKNVNATALLTNSSAANTRLEDVTKLNQATLTKLCSISLGDGFLDKVLQLDTTIKPFSKKGKPKKNRTKISAQVTLEDKNHVMVKETREALRSLCKDYKDIFISMSYKASPLEDKKPIARVTGLVDSHQKQINRLLIRRQKKFSRCQVNSKGRQKARVALQKVHLKIKRRRNDFLHKLSYEIIKNFDYIFIKKYDFKNIMLSAYTPLAKILREKSWDRFIHYLQYKADWYGKRFVLASVGIDGRGAHG